MTESTYEELVDDIPPTVSDVEEEEVTGEDVITSPFDPTLIRVETQVTTINLVLARIKEGEIDLAPDFQRKAGIWKPEAMSRLIESMLMRIPLPAFYMDGTDDDRWIVIDGLQRLTTLKRFVLDKDLKLCGLEFLTNLTNKTYDELPRNLQRRIQETQITIYLITRGTPDEVKFTIFRRINTGGQPLSPQEIRHALNQGPIAAMLRQLAQSPEFKRATAGGVSDTRMEDRELVLRFLAFTIMPYTDYTAQDFDAFLSTAMRTLNGMTAEERSLLEQQFKRSMTAARLIFDKDAFRKRYKEKEQRKPINKALFETWSVNLNRLSDQELAILVQRGAMVRSRFIELMNDREFDGAISQGTGDVTKVRRRFNRVEQLLQEIIA